ncbi:unnamed protein product [Calypogeia fissa]
MELVRDVGVKNYPWPKNLEVLEQDESAERRGVGIANPHPVGLPSLVAATAQVAAQDLAVITKKEAPKGNPQRKEGQPHQKVNVEPERVASPPQSSARASDEEDIQIISRRRRPIEIINEEEDRGVRSTKIRKVDPKIVAKARQANHREFWAEMGLKNFVGLKWDCTGGTLGQCEEFLKNYNKTSTKVNNRVLDLSEKRLALIFKLGEPKNRTAGLRAKQWKSAKFFGPKEKNGYKWSQCTDPEMVERLEFMRCAMYIMEKKSTISGSMVREVEEVLGGSIDWAKQFHKQIHHKVESLRLNKKSILGSHLRMILRWYKDQYSKTLVNPLPDSIPPPALAVRQIAQPISIEDQERNGVVASSTKRPRNGQLLEVAPGEMEAPDIAGVKMPLTSLEVVGSAMVDMFSPSKKRRVAQRVESSESNMDEGNSPTTLLQHNAPGNGTAEQMEHDGEGRPPNVPIGPSIPRHLQDVVFADTHRGADKLVEELKTMSSTEYCEEYATASRTLLEDHAAGLCAYIRWLATRVEQNQETILNLNDQVEQLSTAEDYDQLVKEKSS